MKWTDAQQSAIDAPRPGQLPSQTILVSAAAGSGKTAVLVERMIQRLKRRELSIQELMVVTFTKAAAAEMKARIGKTSGRVPSHRRCLFRRTIEYVAVCPYFYFALLLPMGDPQLFL